MRIVRRAATADHAGWPASRSRGRDTARHRESAPARPSFPARIRRRRVVRPFPLRTRQRRRRRGRDGPAPRRRQRHLHRQARAARARAAVVERGGRPLGAADDSDGKILGGDRGST